MTIKSGPGHESIMNLVFQAAHYMLLFDSEVFKIDNLNYKVRPGEMLPVNLNHI